MKVLLTNDDGIHAPGLMALYQELNGDFDLYVVAPESEMSAVGHAITLAYPLRVKVVHKNGAFFGYGVTGTPADCVKIAVQELLEGHRISFSLGLIGVPMWASMSSIRGRSLQPLKGHSWE